MLAVVGPVPVVVDPVPVVVLPVPVVDGVPVVDPVPAVTVPVPVVVDPVPVVVVPVGNCVVPTQYRRYIQFLFHFTIFFFFIPLLCFSLYIVEQQKNEQFLFG